MFKKYGEKTDNPSVRIYVNKIENRIMLIIKTRYYLKLLMPETKKLLESNESKTAKDKNGENVPNLEIAEVVLVPCNIVNSYYLQSLAYIYS